MARKRRKIIDGLPVHVVQRGVNKCDIFANDKDRISYLDFLVEASDKHNCPVHCYVLMGNHVHLLMTATTRDALRATLHALNTRYVWHSNHRHERTGPLFESRYKTSIIDNDHYLKVCYQYIELNPVRAKFCNSPEDCRWSSHRHHAYGEPDRIVTQHRGYTVLGRTDEERQKRYQGWFEKQPSDADEAWVRMNHPGGGLRSRPLISK